MHQNFVLFLSSLCSETIVIFYVLLFARCYKCVNVVINDRFKGYSLLSCRC